MPLDVRNLGPDCGSIDEIRHLDIARIAQIVVFLPSNREGNRVGWPKNGFTEERQSFSQKI